ncbi:alpha/beta hydrolase [Actinoplanes sp. NPDC051346]|uniref:alpha/beta hydrolase n=1 Tax=Actinoplanes sp. NPDC051346 TaxID=3155048 RepID=UPI0034407D6D
MWRQVVQGTTAVVMGLGLVAPVTASTTSPTVVWPSSPVTAYRVNQAVLRAAGSPYADWSGPTRQFLHFDRTDGTAVEVLGDLATADRIAVLVPGAGTGLTVFDRPPGPAARRAPAAQARAVAVQLRTEDPAARTAVVAWLGYHAPEDPVLDAARSTLAAAGADRLLTFLTWLAGQRPAATVTLVGHSYGTVVLGIAADRLPRQVSDLVAIGSPGMDASSVRELHTTARVWAAEAPTDWIRRVPGIRVGTVGHGPRPASAAFGARPLPTDGVTGHDGYLVPGAATLPAIARVVLGQQARVLADAAVGGDA